MTIEIRHDGPVAILTLRNAPNNHLGLGTISQLADAFDVTDSDLAIRAILLRSEGRVFCAGADLVHANPVADPLPPGERSPFYMAAARLFGVATPVVAAVQGAAVGAGLGLALVADFRIATPEARFVANFVQLGLHPGFGISAVLERVIGRQRAAMMLLTGRRIRGEEAERWGLVDQLVSADALEATALALAHEIAAAAPLAVASTRRTMRGDLRALVEAATDHELAEQAKLMRTEDFAEGVRAVTERRPGRFVGR
ncbi:enoyl-CoA hydratase/isomerase family protein [uncultured Sphingomonas sp.]|uniref:enoyl-CoA hydratase/isomerase family protein n=1 Tax=uncultured Sphingomonas sp. TaxID=158754 RepID=UPI0025E08FAC|nr:enoyl-CoA hydratase/isomerase family protein [uncultured Sphingomonas sp.]